MRRALGVSMADRCQCFGVGAAYSWHLEVRTRGSRLLGSRFGAKVADLKDQGWTQLGERGFYQAVHQVSGHVGIVFKLLQHGSLQYGSDDTTGPANLEVLEGQQKALRGCKDETRVRA